MNFSVALSDSRNTGLERNYYSDTRLQAFITMEPKIVKTYSRNNFYERSLNER